MDNSLEIGPEATLYTNQLTSPTVPAVGAGKDIKPLRAGSGLAPKYAQLEMDLASGATVTLPGPVKLYIERGTKVRYATTLNDGNAIIITTTEGFQQLLQGIALGDRAEIVPNGALTGGGGFTARLVAVKGSP